MKTQAVHRKKFGVKYMALSGIMAALILVTTAYIGHIPIGANGGYIHFGDAIIYLTATILPMPYSLVAAAIGGGLADLLTAPMWAPATIVIKMLITLSFTNKSVKIVTFRNVMATILAYFISAVGYWIAEYILFGNGPALYVSMIQNLVQSGGSAIIFIVLGLALEKAHIKDRLL